MKALLVKELKSILCSSTGAFFAIAFLFIAGSILWLFPGNFSITQGGQASLSPFFKLSPILLAVLIPALTMRLFAEERKLKTLDILRSRPVSFSAIYYSKFLASALFIFITLATTVIYVYSIYQLANPVGNIDLQSILTSYISLFLISLVFLAIGLFTSSLSSNLVIALLLSIFICLFSFSGFDLLSSLFSSGKTQTLITSLGLSHHYSLMQRGVIQLNNLIVILNYTAIFFALTLLFNQHRKTSFYKYTIAIFALNIICLFMPNIRIDFTADKRYTLSDYSKQLLTKVKDKKQPIDINIYLEGDLNAGFQYLKDATTNLLADFNQLAGDEINVKYHNPYIQPSDQDGTMTSQGMPGILLNETDREGRVSQKKIYPYAQVISNSDTLVVSLLKNISGYTADENLNASVEDMEFEFVDAIRLLNQQQSKHIAFIEGHGELPRHYVFDAESLLSKYYFIDRGQIGNDVSELSDFEAIIIAGSTNTYSETEKYIIDQYIMNGGKVLWLLDGAYYSPEDLVKDGYSASMKNNSNLDDLLFSYGVRINPDLIQDSQCASIYLMVDEQNPKPTIMPCYYMPLLIPSTDHPITKNIRDVKSAFASSIDIINSGVEVTKNVLLTSSANSHKVNVPEPIDFEVQRIQDDLNYFDQSFIPVAISLEGPFQSAFTNRLAPEGITNTGPTISTSKSTKMVVVTSSNIIRNEIRGQGNETQVMPIGFDVVSQQQFGNRDFIVNAVNWLTDNEGWMELRTKNQQMRILNKKKVYETQNKYAAINIGIPILFILLTMGGTYLYRKRKYEKRIE